MSWWAIILVIPYSVGTFVCARLVAGHLAWKWVVRRRAKYEAQYDQYVYTRTSPDLHRLPTDDDWIGAVCVGLLAGLIWPLVWLSRHMPWERFAIGAEAEAVRRERAKQIAEFEREEGWQ